MRKTVLLLTCIQAMIPSVPESGMTIERHDEIFDLLPLTRNLYYVYDYRSESRVTELAYVVQLSIDSGTVEYIVHDSTMANDSTIAWSLEERQTLWHRRYDRNLSRDSMYWTHD